MRRALRLLGIPALLASLSGLGAQENNPPPAQDPEREKALSTAKAAAQDPLNFDRSIRTILQTFCYK